MHSPTWLSRAAAAVHRWPLFALVLTLTIGGVLASSAAFTTGATLFQGIGGIAPFTGLAAIVAPPPTLDITGVATNHSSVKIFVRPFAGAADYRVYDVNTPNDVKYAGSAYMIAGPSCPGYACNAHFASTDGTTPTYPYSILPGPQGGPQVIMGAAPDLEYNGAD